MRTISFLLVIFVLFLAPFSINAFAQTTYDVNIPTGAASPDAPYFWYSEKDGSTSGDVEILIGDTIVWKNADTKPHTVTSGFVAEGFNDIFDSGIIERGKQFSYNFTDTGNYPYFCSLHPWMVGTIIVTDGFSIIPNVGMQVGDGTTFFDVEYNYSRLLSTATVDEEQKLITFEIIGNAKSENHDLELRLPSGLIDGPFVIWVDDKKILDFEHVTDEDLNILLIPLDANSQILTIAGTSIVPEFGSMTMIILGLSIVTMIILNQRVRYRL